jgi:hypothetical protein
VTRVLPTGAVAAGLLDTQTLRRWQVPEAQAAPPTQEPDTVGTMG